MHTTTSTFSKKIASYNSIIKYNTQVCRTNIYIFESANLSRTLDRREKLVINIHGLMRNRVPSVNIERNSHRIDAFSVLFCLYCLNEKSMSNKK